MVPPEVSIVSVIAIFQHLNFAETFAVAPAACAFQVCKGQLVVENDVEK